jgi:putative ABC transport system permease protein
MMTHSISAHQSARMGFSGGTADLVLVPRATLVNITSSLLTVQPTDETLPAELGQRIGALAGVARVAPQRITPTLVEGQHANLIAFDPAHDFSVLTWVEDRRQGPLDGLILGGRLAGQLGASLSVCGLPLRVDGRLGKTGVGPFDESYFVSFQTLDEIASFCRGSDIGRGGAAVAPPEAQAAPAIPGVSHDEANMCLPDLPPGRVSAFLVQLAPGAKMEDVKFALAQLPDVRIAARCSSASAPSPRCNFLRW